MENNEEGRCGKKRKISPHSFFFFLCGHVPNGFLVGLAALLRDDGSLSWHD